MECLEDRMLLSVAPLLPVAAAVSSTGGTTIVAPTPTPITTVTTIPVKIQAVVGIPYSGDVGQIKGLSPSLLSRLHATVQWGDNPSDPLDKIVLSFDSTGILHVQDTHAYAKVGTYAVTVNVYLDPPAGSLAPTQLFTINSTATVTQNSLGGVTIYPPLNQPFTGVVGTFTYASPIATPAATPISNPVAPVFVAQISWGDGTASVGKVVLNTATGTCSVVGTHTYDAVGTYRMVIVVTSSPVAVPVATVLPILPIAPVLTTIYSTAIVQAISPVV
jgi:hypothetical protein